MGWTLYCVRHVIASVGIIVLAAVLWTVAYALLLIAAIIGGIDLGGILAYPTGLIGCILLLAVLIVFVFFPACALGYLLIRWSHWNTLVAIPWVWTFGYVISFAYMQRVTSVAPSLSEWLLNYLLYLSLPLGIYWWISDGAFALFNKPAHWLRSKLAYLNL